MMRRRIIAPHLPVALLTAAMCLSLAAARPARIDAGAGGDIQGDVTCDAAVNSVDSLQILRSVAGLGTAAGCLDAAGDVNCDGEIDSVDSLRILRHVAGLSNSPPDGCTPIGEQLGGGPTSYQLIDAAVESGLDAETGLLYEFYAAFSDDRLPPAYRGDDESVFENPAMLGLPGAWDGLSQETRDALAPFLKTPPEPGSWFQEQAAPAGLAAGASDWVAVDAPVVPVRVWYHSSHPTDEQKAQSMIAALEATIWQSLTTYMGKQPLPDCGAGCPSGGGDPRLDIYLVKEGIRPFVQWNPPDKPACRATPVFMVFARDRSNAILAHEMMHTIQFAFNAKASCGDYHWFMEASAQWAMDYVYPNANEEQEVAWSLLSDPHLSLNFAADPHWYGAYLYPFYLTRIGGQEEAVRAIWDKLESAPTSLAAINEVTPGGFEGAWPDFARKNWNQGPVRAYQDADGLTDHALPYGGAPISLAAGDALVLGRTFEPLSSLYYHFQFLDEARSVRFRSNRLSEAPGMKVWAVRKTGAGWQAPEDWTAASNKSFCRDQTDISELVIIIANSDWQGGTRDLMDLVPVVEAGDQECTGWIGTVSSEAYDHGYRYTTEVSGLRFEINPDQGNQDRYTSYTLMESPTVTWEASGTGPGGCVVSGEMKLDPADGTIGGKRVNGALTIDIYENDYSMSIFGWDVDATRTVDCDLSPPAEMSWPNLMLLNTGLPNPTVEDGPALDGEYLMEQGQDVWHRYTWHFEPAP